MRIGNKIVLRHRKKPDSIIYVTNENIARNVYQGIQKAYPKSPTEVMLGRTRQVFGVFWTKTIVTIDGIWEMALCW